MLMLGLALSIMLLSVNGLGETLARLKHSIDDDSNTETEIGLGPFGNTMAMASAGQIPTSEKWCRCKA